MSLWGLERFFLFSNPFPDETGSEMDRSTRSYASEFGGKSQYGGSQKSTYGVEIDPETMEKRRALEHQLVTKYDKTTINPREECWVLMDAEWLYRWADWIAGKVDIEEVGRISTENLIDPDTREPLYGLEAKINYRGVPQLVYYILKELHGKDRTPEFCRYTVDIYQPSVPPEKLAKFRPHAINKARILVHKIKTQWLNWELDYSDDEEDNLCCCCGYITKEHVEAFIYWAVMCCARRRDGRRNISYRQYKPLTAEASEHGFPDSQEGEGNMDESGDREVGGNREVQNPMLELTTKNLEKSAKETQKEAAEIRAIAEERDLERSYYRGTNFLARM